MGPLLRVAAPDVGMLRGVELPFGTVASDQDGDPVRARADRLLRKVASGVPRALEVGVSASQERDDDLERLLEATKDVVLGQTEIVGLAGPGVTGAQAEDEPSAADLVESLGRLGDDPGVAVERGHDPRPDLHPRGHGGHGAGHRHAFPDASGRAVLVAPQQLVGRPDRVEPDRLRLQSNPLDVRPSGRRPVGAVLHEREHDADLERAHGSLRLLGRESTCWPARAVVPRPGVRPSDFGRDGTGRLTRVGRTWARR